MLEKRVKVGSVEKAKSVMGSLRADFKGDYAFKDIIFVPKIGEFDLNKDFIRVRSYSKTNWKTKSVVLVKKKTLWENNGKVSKVVLKKEFDKEKEAFDFIDKKYNWQFKKGFEYSREGWEYQLNSSCIFIEDIEKIGPTVEVESEDREEMENLFNKIGIVGILEDSMPEVMRKEMLA